MSSDGKRERVIDITPLNASALLSSVEPYTSHLTAVYEQVPVALCLIDTQLRYVTVNHLFARLIGRERHEMIGQPVSDSIPLEQLDLARVFACIRSGLPLPDTLLSLPGIPHSLTVRYQAIHDAQGLMNGLSLALLETHMPTIPPPTSVEDRYSIHYRNMVELNPQIAWVANPAGKVLEISRQFANITGYPADIALGDNWLNCVHPDDRQSTLDTWSAAIIEGTAFDMEIRVCHVERGWSWAHSRATPSHDRAGNILYWYGNTEDIHERKLLELKLVKANRRLEIQARTDSLTRLPNRREFKRTLNEQLLRSRHLLTPLGLIMIDIDHFKQFNDRYGHLSGDACLRLVARELRKTLRRGTDLVARYGGEEFAAILPDTTEAGCHRVAQQMLDAISSLEIRHQDSDVRHITISLGLTVYHPQRCSVAIDPAELLSTADQALYLAKSQGRNQFSFMPLAGC